jgi:hypothetical protein
MAPHSRQSISTRISNPLCGIVYLRITWFPRSFAFGCTPNIVLRESSQTTVSTTIGDPRWKSEAEYSPVCEWLIALRTSCFEFFVANCDEQNCHHDPGDYSKVWLDESTAHSDSEEHVREEKKCPQLHR